jgi:tRNA-uridine 2-sulfurtransferase
MKAIALISGGLDSTLAAKIVADIGTTVVGVHFQHPFCAREKKTEQALLELTQALARQAGIELRVIRLQEEFMAIVRNPVYGYGSNLNPCIDCRVLMLKKAKRIMDEEHAGFLVTGEVVGQRPMSQQRNTMNGIDRKAGVEGLVLRPLSAKLMAETEAEKNGWVDRQKLYALSGRSRKPQIDLAVMRGIIDYPNAAGGCLLTDPRFSDRAKDLMAHDRFTMDNVELLKLGRHFRISKSAKLVVGRNEAENASIESLAEGEDVILMPPGAVAGPTGLCRGSCGEEDLRLAATIICRYCDRLDSDSLELTYRGAGDADFRTITVSPALESEIEKVRI